MKKINLITAATALLLFTGCAGVAPKQMKPVTQEQTQFPNLKNSTLDEQNAILHGALKQVHAQVKSIHKDWDRGPDFLYYKFSTFAGSGEIDGQGYYAIWYRFNKPNILTIDADWSQTKKYKNHDNLVTLLDETNALLPAAIMKFDQMCFDYKNSVTKNNVEIVTSSLSDILPKGLKDAIIKDNSESQTFNVNQCSNVAFLEGQTKSGNIDREFSYENNMFLIKGRKIMDLEKRTTKLSISDISYNFFANGFKAENKDLLVSIDRNTNIQISNKTDEMITLNQISQYYGEDISSKSYNIVLAPHSVQTIKSQIVIPLSVAENRYRPEASYIYRPISSTQSVEIGIAVGYTLNGNKTLTKLQESKVQ